MRSNTNPLDAEDVLSRAIDVEAETYLAMRAAVPGLGFGRVDRADLTAVQCRAVDAHASAMSHRRALQDALTRASRPRAS